MKSFVFIAALLMSSVCWGWNCPSGQIRQQAPADTPTSTPYYDVVEGIAFVCVPTTPPTSGTTNSNTNSNANSNTNDNKNTNNTSVTNTLAQKQKQQQTQSQNQTANGGNASASSTSTGGNAVGNGDNSNNSITNIAAPKIPVATAVTPPIMPTAPCLKGYGGAGQTMSMGLSGGFSRVDQGCDDRELARSFEGPQTVASCKILLNTKKAKKAGITMADCLQPQPVVQVIAQPVQTPAPQVIVVEVPAVQPAPISPPEYKTEITVQAPKKKVVKHLPPNCQNVIQRVCKGAK